MQQHQEGAGSGASCWICCVSAMDLCPFQKLELSSGMCDSAYIDKHVEINHFSQQLVSGVSGLLEGLQTTCIPLKSCLGLSIS